MSYKSLSTHKAHISFILYSQGCIISVADGEGNCFHSETRFEVGSDKPRHREVKSAAGLLGAPANDMTLSRFLIVPTTANQPTKTFLIFKGVNRMERHTQYMYFFLMHSFPMIE